ncbi:hypothetical protein K469DRAFT_13300 [Zopfia rhizophila CBS 207.26]|uniref:Transmembrane protein n=1 Tax=Zopfia rhizophila CBS 207.26 TaxID=1314779 RepID=A0A6A6EXI1_9PEZI|nr:hypothetical protein K469DRAFT_13300 [Zopfia rhizophila CBS 207.26]
MHSLSNTSKKKEKKKEKDEEKDSRSKTTKKASLHPPVIPGTLLAPFLNLIFVRCIICRCVSKFLILTPVLCFARTGTLLQISFHFVLAFFFAFLVRFLIFSLEDSTEDRDVMLRFETRDAMLETRSERFRRRRPRLGFPGGGRLKMEEAKWRWTWCWR